MIFTVVSQGQHQSVSLQSPNTLPTVFPCCCLTAQTVRDAVAVLSGAADTQKKNLKGLLLSSKGQTFFLFFLKKKNPTQLTSPFITAWNCSCSYSPKNNKIPSVFSWAPSPARQNGFRTQIPRVRLSWQSLSPQTQVIVSNSPLVRSCLKTIT